MHGVVSCDIDIERVTSARQQLPALGHRVITA